MTRGVTMQELDRLFDFLKQSKTNDEMTILIDNGMCKSLYSMMEGMVKLKDMQEKEIEELKEKNEKNNDIIKKLKRELLDKKNIVEKSKYFKLVYTDEEMEHIWNKTIISKIDEIIEILKGGE